MEPNFDVKLLNKMIRYLRKHNGEELTTAKVVEEISWPIENMDLMDIDLKIKELAPKRELVLDSSKYDGLLVGEPYNVPYVIVDMRKKIDKHMKRKEYDKEGYIPTEILESVFGKKPTKKKKVTYVESASYYPKEIRKKAKIGEYFVKEDKIAKH